MSWLSKQYLYFQDQDYHYLEINSIFVFLLAVNIFVIFRSIKIKSNKVSEMVTFITPHLLYVYVLHDNPQVRSLLWKELGCKEFMKNPLMILHMIAWVLIVFVVCVLIDVILDKLLKKVSFEKIDVYANRMIKKVIPTEKEKRLCKQ